MMRTVRWHGRKLTVLLLDLACVYTSYLLAYMFRFPQGMPASEWASFHSYLPWLGFLTAATYYFFQLYDFTRRGRPAQQLYNLILAHGVIAMLLIVLNYWLQAFSLPRSVVLVAYIIQIIFIFTYRLSLIYIAYRRNGQKKALIIIGPGETDHSLLERIDRCRTTWFRACRVLESEQLTTGLLDEIWDDMDVLIVGQGLDASLKTQLIRAAGQHRLEVLIIPDFYELYLQKAETQQLEDLLVYSLTPPHLNPWQRFVKRTADVVISLTMLILSSPIILLLFILIPLTSPGPALFIQERVGLYERSFRLYKFRSMVNHAEASTGPVLATAGDTRITRLGQWLRATRLDELPQLYNILLGNMSLVGPRPERAFFTEQFKDELPHYNYRFMVKPGLTGLAQVMGNYTTEPSDKLRFDLMYIHNYSILLDVQILFQTLGVMLHREQAKGVAQEGVSIAEGRTGG